jgi:hypothetical protein
LIELKDPGAVLELIAVMKLGIVRSAIEPHLADDFEPAMSQPAQGVGMALVFWAVLLIINVGPDTTGQTAAFGFCLALPCRPSS